MDPSSTYVCALTLSKKPCQNNSEILVGYIYIIGLQLKKTLSGPNSEELWVWILDAGGKKCIP